MNPLFSIIVTIYNLENYIEECIKSIINQEFENVEVILVDDGSTDNSPKICDRYAEEDKRIKVIHKKNEGVVNARKTGSDLAKGSYVLFVDGDDWVMPNYLSELKRIATEFNPDCICFGYCEVVGEEYCHKKYSVPSGKYTKAQIEKELYPVLIENEYGEYFSPAVWSKAVKKEIMTTCQIGLDPRIKIGEDFACTRPIFVEANSLYITNENLYCYRINPKSAIRTPKPYPWSGPELIGIFLEKKLDMDAFDFRDQLFRNIVHNLFNVAVSQFNRENNYFAIRKDIRKFLKNEYYDNAIRKCKYRSFKGLFAKFTLKSRLCILLFIINKYKFIRK